MPITADGAILEGDIWPLPANATAHPRGAGTYSRVLGRYVREYQVISLMEALRRASLVAAQILEQVGPADEAGGAPAGRRRRRDHDLRSRDRRRSRNLRTPVEIRTIDVLTIADGVITALWVVSDELGMLTQLDAVGLG
jgi:hypothetical protein